MLCFVDLVKICYQSQIKLADLNFKAAVKVISNTILDGHDRQTGFCYLTVIE